MTFKINFYISARKAVGILRDCFESADQFRKYYRLNNIKFSNPQTQNIFPFFSFHLFVSSLISFNNVL